LGGQAAIALLEPADAALVRALLDPLPGVPTAAALDGSLPGDRRPVRTLVELAALRQRLKALHVCVDLVARLAHGSMAEAAALCPPGRAARLSTLLNTAIAWHILEGRTELKALDGAHLREFLGRALLDGQVRPELRRALQAGLLSRADRSDEEVEALTSMVDAALDRLADELGGLAAMGLLDPRYVGDSLLIQL
jgi:hypothetical protein